MPGCETVSFEMASPSWKDLVVMRFAKLTFGIAIAFGTAAFAQSTATTPPATTTRTTTMPSATTANRMAETTTNGAATTPGTVGHGLKPNNTNVLVDRKGHTVSVTKVRRKHGHTVTKTTEGHRNHATMP